MKKLGCFNGFLFFLNSVSAVLLLLAYVLPYVPPETFPFLSILSLGVPLLLIVNAVFMVYWVLRLRKQLLLSLLVLLLGMNHIGALFRFSEAKIPTEKKHDFSVMSYNVRQFNRYHWITDKDIPTEISRFVRQEAPDMISIQEYYATGEHLFEDYPYRYVQLKGEHVGQAFFSRYPIVGKGSLAFKNTYNNAIYADVLVNKDTIRVYNVHLESLKIIPKVDSYASAEHREELITRVGKSFRKQQAQVKRVLKSIHESPYPCIIAGDINNSVFSYVYRKLSMHYTDGFKEAGTGFGRTFVFDFIPLRIDVILTDPFFSVEGFKTYDLHLSDHYPIMAWLRMGDGKN